MPNDKGMTHDKQLRSCHPERREAKSKDPVKLPLGFATGFLDFARNDRRSNRRSSFVIRHSPHA